MKKGLSVIITAILIGGLVSCSENPADKTPPDAESASRASGGATDSSNAGNTNQYLQMNSQDLSNTPQRTVNVTVLESDINHTRIEIQVPDVQEEAVTVNDATFQLVSLSGYDFTTGVGKPRLPVIRETIGIPDGASLKVTVLDDSYSTYHSYKIYPVQQLELNYDTDSGLVIDEEFYSQDIMYPEDIVNAGAPSVWRDISVIGLEVNPVQFNPATGELRVHDHILVELEYSGGADVKKTVDPKFGRMYRSTILNYEFLNIEEGYSHSGETPAPEMTPPEQAGTGLD